MIRYSCKKSRFLLEVHSMDIELPSNPQHPVEQMNIQKKQKFFFDLNFELGGFTANSSKQMKENQVKKDQLNQSAYQG